MFNSSYHQQFKFYISFPAWSFKAQTGALITRKGATGSISTLKILLIKMLMHLLLKSVSLRGSRGCFILFVALCFASQTRIGCPTHWLHIKIDNVSLVPPTRDVILSLSLFSSAHGLEPWYGSHVHTRVQLNREQDTVDNLDVTPPFLYNQITN